MTRNQKSKEDRTPRIYDKSSGEYRPVFAQQARSGENRTARYATPQSRANARKRRRQRTLLVFYFLTFVAVITASIALSLTVLFKIDTIQVTGTSRYSVQEIIQAGGIQKGENLFLTKTGEAGAKIRQKLPYIGTVTVSRRLPAKIIISVGEEPVSGALAYNGKYAIISPSGKVLELAEKIPENCPVIKGLKLSKAEVGEKIVYADAAQQATFQNLTAAITSSQLKKVTELDFSLTYKLQIVYDRRITMNLGLASDLDKKLRFGKSILDAGKIKDTEKGVLNLSVAAENEHAYFDPDYTTASAASSQPAQNSSK